MAQAVAAAKFDDFVKSHVAFALQQKFVRTLVTCMEGSIHEKNHFTQTDRACLRDDRIGFWIVKLL